MLKNSLSIVIISLGFISNSQIKLDIELVSGYIINGKTYDFSENATNFDLTNGFTYGLGFDLWLKEDWSLSFGFSLGQSRAQIKRTFSGEFKGITSSGGNVGTLKDRVFYLGVKKNILIGNSTSIQPFLGLYYNPFFFDSQDIKYSVYSNDADFDYFESEDLYARFNMGNSALQGSFGGRIGMGISQKVRNIGVFSLSMSYSLDLAKNLDQKINANSHYIKWDGVSSTYDYEYYNNTYETFERGRHLWQVEVGFKMPCSILFGT
ncbi:MAG: hypothetical protein ACJA0U_000617 [Salibacteraceae bacterium]|jgi:hypothetical protein